MSKLSEFAIVAPRPMPVLLLLDTSGSMEANGKIRVLNERVSEMIRLFSKEDSSYIIIHVAVITFGGTSAHLHQDFKPANAIQWADLKASGKTPMGAAFELALEILNDHQKVPSTAFIPTIALVSDGAPTDDWETSLNKFLSSERAAKASRFALAIGDDANTAMLARFDDRVAQAHEVGSIINFFNLVTMSVQQRSRSQNPNIIPTEDDY